MTTPLAELAPAEARRILNALRWEASPDFVGTVLVDDSHVYGVAVDDGEAKQVEAEVRALLEEVCGALVAADASHIVYTAADYALCVCGDCSEGEA